MRSAARLIVCAFLAAVIFFAGVALRPTLGRFRRHLAREDGNPERVYDPVYYGQRTLQFEVLRVNRRIVFLGDSRIDYAEWSELFARCDIANGGVSGDTTAGVLKRLSSSIPSEAMLCLIQVGVNDLQNGSSSGAVRANYDRILQFLREQRQCRVLVTPILLVSEDRAELNARINECNRELAALAAKRNAQWLDLNCAVAPAGFLPPQYSNDGVHLNGAGYLKMRDAIAPLLE